MGQSRSRGLKQLAKAARDVAFSCVEGTNPEFGTKDLSRCDKPHCALGYVLYRAKKGFLHYPAYYAPYREDLSAAQCIVMSANDCAHDPVSRAQHLVFPLLWLADELDTAAAKVAVK